MASLESFTYIKWPPSRVTLCQILIMVFYTRLKKFRDREVWGRFERLQNISKFGKPRKGAKACGWERLFNILHFFSALL